MRFILPFTYGLATRAKTHLDKLSFCVIFVMVQLFICGVYAYGSLFAVKFALALTAYYSVYEIGYLQNDVFTTKRESAPTFRLTPSLHEYVAENVYSLIVFRVIFCLLCVMLLAISGLKILPFLCGLAAIACLFALHNQVRSRWNILTYFVLISLKYMILPLLFIEEGLGSIYVIMLFSFVLPRSFEHACKKKYNLPVLSNLNLHVFRVYYYLVAATVGVCLWLVDSRFMPFAIVALWFFAYRSIILAALGTVPWLKKRTSR